MSKRIEEDSALLSVLGYDEKPSQKKANGSRAKTTAKDETRTRRVQLIFPPTLYDQLKEKAWEEGQSVNETIIQAVTAYLKRR